MVEHLRKARHSLRAIAGAVGAGVATVHADLAGVRPRTPAATVGLDGTTMLLIMARENLQEWSSPTSAFATCSPRTRRIFSRARRVATEFDGEDLGAVPASLILSQRFGHRVSAGPLEHEES